MSETRIDRRFTALKAEGRAAFVTYVMAGDPNYETALEIVKGLPAAGADIIEVGLPFTDGRWPGNPEGWLARACLRHDPQKDPETDFRVS